VLIDSSRSQPDEGVEQRIADMEKLLLRYTSDLRILYKQYSSGKRSALFHCATQQPQPADAESLTFSLGQFWRLLYESRVIPQNSSVRDVAECLRSMETHQAQMWSTLPHAGTYTNEPTSERIDGSADVEREAAPWSSEPISTCYDATRPILLRETAELLMRVLLRAAASSGKVRLSIATVLCMSHGVSRRKHTLL
jgi:hypothetical protein